MTNTWEISILPRYDPQMTPVPIHTTLAYSMLSNKSLYHDLHLPCGVSTFWGHSCGRFPIEMDMRQSGVLRADLGDILKVVGGW